MYLLLRPLFLFFDEKCHNGRCQVQTSGREIHQANLQKIGDRPHDENGSTKDGIVQGTLCSENFWLQFKRSVFLKIGSLRNIPDLIEWPHNQSQQKSQQRAIGKGKRENQEAYTE